MKQHLFEKYLRNECSASEVEQLMRFFNTDHDGVLKDLVLRELEKDNAEPENEDYQPLLDNVYNQLHIRIQGQKLRPLWVRLLAVASIISIFSVGSYFIWNLFHTKSTGSVLQVKRVVKDIAPGGDKAVLILANGRRIKLNDLKNGDLTEQTGVKITKTKDGQLIYQATNVAVSKENKDKFNTIETPVGGQYQVMLPDGTKVWLNSASSLHYPIVFTGKERRVEITGEAYFEVAHNKNMPFYVKAGQTEVKVLGTHFNIAAYTDDKYQETTLLEGSVKITKDPKNLDNAQSLIPGQQARINKETNQMEILPHVNTESIVAWKSGIFLFDNTPIESVMQQIKRWYNADIVYEGNKPDVTFTGIISRNNYVSQVLTMLQTAGGVDFNVEGNKIIVKKTNYNN